MGDFDFDDLDEGLEYNQWEGKEPVVVVIHGSGFELDVAMRVYTKVITTASKLGMDAVLLGHPNTYGFFEEGYELWPQYINHLVEQIDNDAVLKDRPILLMGHSRGAVISMGLASRLGDRVLKVYLVAALGLSLGVTSIWDEWTERFKKNGDDDLLTFFQPLAPADEMLKHYVSMKKEERDAYLADSKAKNTALAKWVKLTRMHLVESIKPRMTGDDPHIKEIPAPIVVAWPGKDPHSTRERAETYKGCTSGGFEIWEFPDADHTDVMFVDGFLSKVFKDMFLFFPTDKRPKEEVYNAL